MPSCPAEDVYGDKILSGEDGVAAELFLNPEQLVELGEPLGAAGHASLDLSGSESHHQVGGP